MVRLAELAWVQESVTAVGRQGADFAFYCKVLLGGYGHWVLFKSWPWPFS